MDKENESTTEENSSKTKQFIKDHWPMILSAGTVAGAAVFITAKFLLQKNKSKKGLEAILDEAIDQTSTAHAFLETGQAIVSVVGKQPTSQTAQKLAQNTDDPELKKALTTLSQTSKL